jgi:hypothetical protein
LDLQVWFFMAVRVLHILSAATWFGAAAFIGIVLLRVLSSRDIESAASERLHHVIGIFMASTAALTIISGLFLFWKFTNGISPSILLSKSGIALGIGGTLAIAAALLGRFGVGPAIHDVRLELDLQLRGPERWEPLRANSHLRLKQRQLKVRATVLLVLMTTVLLLMTTAHFL